MKKIGFITAFFIALCFLEIANINIFLTTPKFNFLNSGENSAVYAAPTFITDDPCPSGVVYTDNSGVQLCVAQINATDKNTLSNLSLSYDFNGAGIVHVGTVAPDVFPHRQLSWQGSDIPLHFNANGTSLCTDTNTICCSNQASICDAGPGDSLSAYAGDCSANKGCSSTTVATQSNPLTCEMENIHFKDPTNSSMDGKYEHLLYCDSEITSICSNPSSLRAEYGGAGSQVYSTTDRLNTTADATGNLLSFSCAQGNFASVQLNLPTQGHCDLNYNSGSTESNGYCDWTPGNGGALSAPDGVINCSQKAYRADHPSECACTFDTTHNVGNGNTYTAIGCIPSNVGGVMNIFLTIAIAFASFFALIRMMVGGYEIMTNPAGPEEIGEGKDLIVNAALGLIFVVLCVVIMKLIGVDVLQLNVIANIFQH